MGPRGQGNNWVVVKTLPSLGQAVVSLPPIFCRLRLNPAEPQPSCPHSLEEPWLSIYSRANRGLRSLITYNSGIAFTICFAVHLLSSNKFHIQQIRITSIKSSSRPSLTTHLLYILVKLLLIKLPIKTLVNISLCHVEPCQKTLPKVLMRFWKSIHYFFQEIRIFENT